MVEHNSFTVHYYQPLSQISTVDICGIIELQLYNVQ